MLHTDIGNLKLKKTTTKQIHRVCFQNVKYNPAYLPWVWQRKNQYQNIRLHWMENNPFICKSKLQYNCLQDFFCYKQVFYYTKLIFQQLGRINIQTSKHLWIIVIYGDISPWNNNSNFKTITNWNVNCDFTLHLKSFSCWYKPHEKCYLQK